MSTTAAKRRGPPSAVEKNTWFLVRRFEGGLVEFENLCGRRLRIQFHNCEWCHQSCAEGKVIKFKSQMICAECHAQKIERKNPIPEAQVFKREFQERLGPINAERRRALRLARATPSWADRRKIDKLYERAQFLTRETGILHEVDHFFPLACAVACGLHVHHNLVVVEAEHNRWKSNKFPLDHSPAWDGMTDKEIMAEMHEMVRKYRTEKRNMQFALAASNTKA